MKKLLLFALFCTTALFARSNDNDDIIKALKAGSAEQLANYFDSYIDMKMPNKEEIKNMSKNQASIAVKEFFNDNAIKGFELTNQGERMGVTYIIGKLQNGGKGYNLRLYLKTKDGKQQITNVNIN